MTKESEVLQKRLEVAIQALERIIFIVNETKQLIEDEKREQGTND